jgi:hypothetical protein
MKIMAETSPLTSTPPIAPSIEILIQEIQQTPSEQWAHLLEILRIFRQSVSATSSPTSHSTAVNQAAIDLLRSWREEGDETDQRETWEFLKEALDDDRLSDRPLFPS